MDQDTMTKSKLVTPENYARAECDNSFATIVNDVGPNAFRHDRDLMSLDKQPAVTMNRDTVYSFGIYHVPPGTKIILPESLDGRYQSAMVMQNDDFTDQVFYAPGTFEIKSKTEFVAFVIRTQMLDSSGKEKDTVRSLQDAIRVHWPMGTTPKEYQIVDWDHESLLKLRAQYQKDAAKLPNFNNASGARGVIDPDMLRLSASVALGLLPAKDAVYVYRDYGLKGDVVYEATYAAPEFKRGGFFSFTMYGADKHIKSLDCTLNNEHISFNDDGTFTMRFGPKGSRGEAKNFLETPEDNWYLALRIYRPSEDIVKNGFDIAEPKPI